MLAYLEELCAALLAHDASAINRLLAHPLARSLPRQVREEALAISRADPASLRAPIRTLRFYHQTLQLQASEPLATGDPAPPASPPTGQAPGAAGDDAGGGSASSAKEGAASPSPGEPPRDPTDPRSRTRRPRSAPVSNAEAERSHATERGRHDEDRLPADGRDQMELPLDLMAPAAAA